MPLPIVPIGGKQSQCDRGKVLLEIEDSDRRGQAKLLHHDPRADAIRWIEKNSTDERLNYEHDNDRVRVGRHIDGAESGEERPWCGARWPPHTEYLVSDCADQRCCQKSMHEQKCCNHGVRPRDPPDEPQCWILSSTITTSYFILIELYWTCHEPESSKCPQLALRDRSRFRSTGQSGHWICCSGYCGV